MYSTHVNFREIYSSITNLFKGEKIHREVLAATCHANPNGATDGPPS